MRRITVASSSSAITALIALRHCSNEGARQPPPGRTGPRAIRKAIFNKKIADAAMPSQGNQQRQSVIAANMYRQGELTQQQTGASPVGEKVEEDTEQQAVAESASSSPSEKEPVSGADDGAIEKKASDEMKQSPQEEKESALQTIAGSLAKTKRKKTTSAAGGTRSSKDATKGTETTSGINAKKTPDFKIKVKKKPVWGERQLRDQWSIDAMARLKYDNISERMHREYRYHPDEIVRYYMKYVFYLIPVVLIAAFQLVWYWFFGGTFWRDGDFQNILNLFRNMDTSPRSKFSVAKQGVDLDDLRLPFDNREREPSSGHGVLSAEDFDLRNKMTKANTYKF